MEAEVREILKSTLKPKTRVKMGDALANLGRRLGLTNEDLAVIEQTHDTAPAEHMTFE
ncbi:MAG: hypothetical protein LBL26_00070 [Peptococcaceae bacterium]|jgi:plasmid stability protein|nr:hypothetical protein [Peptococcaceae bacterium]